MKKVIKKNYIILLLFSFSAILNAQDYEWINYTNCNQINDIEAEGEYLWIGTTGGLVKYNRLSGEAEFFNKSNSPFPTLGSTNPNAIFDLEIDKEGNKWLALYGGLVKYDGSNWEVYDRFNSGLPYGYVFDIEFDQAGNIWIANYSGGLVFFDGTDWFVYNMDNSDIPYNHLRTLEIDKNGNKWIGGVSIDTLSGITKFDGVNFTYYNNYNSGFPASEDARDIEFNEDGELWCATGLGIVTYDGFTWKVLNDTNSGLPSSSISEITFDKEGNAWVGTAGLSIFDGTEWITYTNENSDLPVFSVKDIAFDEDNNKWLGTNEGLVKFDDQNFNLYEISNSGLPDNSIISLLNSSNGKIFFGSYSGLTSYDGTEWKNFPVSTQLNYLTSLAEDSEGNIWMTSRYSYGFAKFDGNSFTIYNYQNSPIPNDRYQAIAIDNNDKIWIGSEDEGIIRFDGINWFIYNSGNSGLPNNEVNAIVIDSLGNKWIATAGGGLAKFSGSEWKVYNTQNSGISHNNLISLAIDPKGGIWTGGSLGSLSYFDGLNWNDYSLQDSGIFADITCIFIDDEDNKWIGTSYLGIIKFNNDEWEILNSENSGLSSNQINSISSDKSGNIWIATSDGGVSVYKKVDITGFEEKNYINPDGFYISQNYPNPFNPTTKLSFTISQSSLVSLKVYDILGKEVAMLVDEFKPAGSYEITFNAAGLASGVYFYRIQAGSYNQVRKMILLQ